MKLMLIVKIVNDHNFTCNCWQVYIEIFVSVGFIVYLSFQYVMSCKSSVLKKGSVVLVYPIFGCDIIKEQFDKSFWGQLFYEVEKIIIFLVKTHSFCPKYFIICEIISLELFHAHFLHRLLFYVPLLIFCWLTRLICINWSHDWYLSWIN